MEKKEIKKRPLKLKKDLLPQNNPDLLREGDSPRSIFPLLSNTFQNYKDTQRRSYLDR